MSADTFYTIGATHQVCQDYALSGPSYAIVSDGCSSVKDSDWGSRLLTKSLDSIFKTKKTIQFEDLVEALRLSNLYAKMLDLEQECLAATLLCVYETEDGFHAYVSGDGFVVAKTISGKLQIVEHEYESGAPFYLYYSLSPELIKSYKQAFPQKNLKVFNSFVANAEKDVRFTDTVQADQQSIQYFFPKEVYSGVGVVTDGLRSFVKQVKKHTSITNESVGFEKIVGDIFSFKTSEGQYVHRRCQRAFKEFHNKDIKNNDDFAVGVVGH